MITSILGIAASLFIILNAPETKHVRAWQWAGVILLCLNVGFFINDALQGELW